MRQRRAFQYRVLVARGPVPLRPPLQFAISRASLVWLCATLIALLTVEGFVFAEGLGWSGPMPRLRAALAAYRLAPAQSEQVGRQLAALRGRVDAMVAAQDRVIGWLRVAPPRRALDSDRNAHNPRKPTP